MSLTLKKKQSEFLRAADEIIHNRRPDDYKSGSDKRRTGIICDTLSKSAHGRLILNWAKENDVAILFDHQAQGVCGYYMTGLNTVILNAKIHNDKLASTLAHELRHAWQDHQNLITSIGQYKSVTDLIRHTKVIEADAFAFGYLCGYEMHGARGMTATDSRAATFCGAIEDAIAEDSNALQNGKAYAAAFASFKELPTTHKFYNQFCAKNYAKFHEIGSYSLPHIDAVSNHMHDFTFPERKGSDITVEDTQKRLSNVFHKYNYLPYLQKEYGNIAHNTSLHGGFDSETRDIVKHIRHNERSKNRQKKELAYIPRVK